MRRNRNTEMAAFNFNIFIIFTIYLSSIFHPGHGFEVIQPQNRTVNPDGSVSISCEHNAEFDYVVDVRLSGLSLSETKLLCQMGKKDCKDIIMVPENPKRYLFFILNVGPEEMSMKYQCEFTGKKNDLDYTQIGTPTILLPGQKEVVCDPPHTPPPPSSPSTLRSDQLGWILIGLLALMCLYSCVITSFYIRLRCSDKDPENSTYVEMRKVPLSRNPPFEYCR